MNYALSSRLLAACVVRDSGCIEWDRTTDKDGYGKTKVNGKSWRAHRAMWTAAKGRIPDGMLVCHRCDNPRCLNIEHLFLGTPAQNMADKVAKGRYVGGPYCWKNRTAAGANNCNSKLDEASVRRMRALRFAGLGHGEIASVFLVSAKQVEKICSGRAWKHVPMEISK